MSTVLTIIIFVIIAILLIWFIVTSNSLNRAVVKIEEAESDIDVALTKRYDTLTKMIDVVKGYAKHEKETLFEIVNIRKGMTVKEKEEAAKKMDEAHNKINLLAEAYPELRSSENYNTLEKAIVEVEEHLQASRRMFNANVSSLNQSIVTFPISIVAGLKGLSKRDFFETEDIKKEDVKIDL